MNRKHNPWLSLMAALLLAVILVLTCTGCNETAAAVEAEPRFTCEQAGRAGMVNLYLITDTETGVHYLMAELKNGYGYGVGLTQMEG